MDCTHPSEPNAGQKAPIRTSPLDFTIPWTYAECARFLRISEETLRDRVRRGKDAPPRLKIGDERQATVLFWPPAVVAWMTGHAVPASPPAPADEQPASAERRGPGRPRKASVGPARKPPKEPEVARAER